MAKHGACGRKVVRFAMVYIAEGMHIFSFVNIFYQDIRILNSNIFFLDVLLLLLLLSFYSYTI